jgi:hypothetical protein
MQHQQSLLKTPACDNTVTGDDLAGGGCAVRRILFVGQRLSGSAPSLTLAQHLKRVGIKAAYSDGLEGISTQKWLKRVLEHDAIIFVEYSRPELHLQRQFHLAQLLGRPVIRWWVGSDVYKCLRSEDVARAAVRFDRSISANIAVAPHLVDELKEVGITATYVPSLCSLPPEGSHVDKLEKNVLIYLPEDRKEFYGRSEVRKAIEANPRLKFTVIADESHSLAHYPNVDSLGWVGNMQSVWPRVGALLRITEHDGLPRMVLEALALRKQVLYSWPLKGCIYCRSGEEAIPLLATFERKATPNDFGPEAAREIGGDALRRYLEIVEEVRSGPKVKLRARGLRGSIDCQRVMKFPPKASVHKACRKVESSTKLLS